MLACFAPEAYNNLFVAHFLKPIQLNSCSSTTRSYKSSCWPSSSALFLRLTLPLRMRLWNEKTTRSSHYLSNLTQVQVQTYLSFFFFFFFSTAHSGHIPTEDTTWCMNGCSGLVQPFIFSLTPAFDLYGRASALQYVGGFYESRHCTRAELFQARGYSLWWSNLISLRGIHFAVWHLSAWFVHVRSSAEPN